MIYYTANHILSIYKRHSYFITEFTILKWIAFIFLVWHFIIIYYNPFYK